MNKLFLLSIILFVISCNKNESSSSVLSTSSLRPEFPIPTVVYENMADEKAFEERREAYFDLIHSGSLPFDWQAINAENFRLIAEKRALKRQNRAVEIFADGEIEAEWIERGSRDVPGNVRICDFHKATNDIYVISDGGILWKGNINGETWIPLNDHLQLGRNIIKVVDLIDGGIRIIAANGSLLKYSDDEGETWVNVEGLTGASGSGIDLVQLNDATKTLVYLYNSTISGVTKNRIAYSIDNGVNFTFVANLESSNSRFASMDAAYNSTTAYILDENNTVYKFEGDTFSLISDDLGMDSPNRCMIRANEAGGILTLYSLMNREHLYKSTDGGVSFSYVNNLLIEAWDVGFEVSIDDPDIIYFGNFISFRSFNGGVTWALVNDWWDYYDDVANKIHADIMAIEPFKKADGTEFTLIANHGGISISYDNLINTPNIAMQNLNTGQFYDVLSDPNNSALIYGGTQDQGFQRTLSGDSPEASSFEQVISGDYGEMQFTHNGKTIWIQYPGADFQVYPNAETDSWFTHTYNLEGSNMPNYNWIVPTGAAPDPSANWIYAGGGSIDGGSGSYLIKLGLADDAIHVSQYDFDFFAAADGSISAIETTPLEQDFIYVVTETGRFFHSEDEGETFNLTADYIGPSGEWIYTADIFASRNTPGLVFVGGSGYAGEAVYMSKDSAKTFEPLTGDLPNTMVYEMVMDPAEEYLFVASDAGPYVYSMETEEWYEIGGVSAPLQSYTSVEFIPSDFIVRFATWGRGIWDFNISTVAGINTDVNSIKKLSIYPNPVLNKQITVDVSENASFYIFDLNGRKVFEQRLIIGQNKLSIRNLAKGTYIVATKSESGLINTDKLVVL